jgi:hypothetical protein
MEQMTTSWQFPQLLILIEAFHADYTIESLVLIDLAIIRPKPHKWNHLLVLLHGALLR